MSLVIYKLTHINKIIYICTHCYSHKSTHTKYMFDYTSDFIPTHNFMFMFTNYALFHSGTTTPIVASTHTSFYM